MRVLIQNFSQTVVLQCKVASYVMEKGWCMNAAKLKIVDTNCVV